MTQAGKPVDGFVSRKAQALLCYLVLSQGGHSRDKLATLLWGEMAESRARANLRKALSNLRQLLPAYLLITRQEAAFNPERGCWVDGEQLVELLEARPEKFPLPPQVAANLAKGVSLYRGDFLEGFYFNDAPAIEEWLLIWRERVHNLVGQGLHGLAMDHVQRREYAPAIDYLVRLLKLAPWHEAAHRQLMLLLARVGRPDEALAHYYHCCHLLREELGVEPMAETTALYERIRAMQSATHLNLPAQPAPFVGRRRELTAISQQLLDPKCRLLTLTGLGGVGKTRLAVQVASRMGHEFLDGVHFVPLAAVRSPDVLPQAIAGAIGLSFQEGGSPKKQLLTYLRQREYLLVLDGFEHLLAATPLLDDMLGQAGGIKLLVTSRERLNLAWEWLFVVRGLDFPTETQADIGRYGAVRLFSQAARRIQPTFALAADNEAAVVGICRLLAGLPLGLLLAAGWLRTFSCPQIYEAIKADLDFLTGAGSERHSSIRAVLLSSWRMLSGRERRVFCRLSVFPDGFRQEAAIQVAGANPAILATFIDRSLLLRGADGRYGMHGLWLQFAAEQLAQYPSEKEQAHLRRNRYYGEQLARHMAGLARQEPDSLAWVQSEFENLWAGWQGAMAHKQRELAEQFVEGLGLFLKVSHRYPEMIELFGQALSDEEPAAFSLRQARWQRQLGEAYFRLGRLSESLDHHRQALVLLNRPLTDHPLVLAAGLASQLLRQVGHRLGGVVGWPWRCREEAATLEAVRIFERLGQIYFFSSRSMIAFYTAIRGLNLAEIIPSSPELTRLYANMILAVAMIPLHSLARMYSRLALETARQIKHLPSLAWALELTGIYYGGVGHWDKLEQAAGEAVEISLQLGDRRRWEEVQVLLAHLAHQRGQFGRGVEIWREIYLSALQRDDIQVQKWSLSGQADGLAPLGRLEEAADLLQMALEIPSEIDEATDISCYGSLAIIRLRQDRLPEALAAAETAFALIRQSSPLAFSAIEGYTGAAEVYIQAWAAYDPEWKEQAKQACRTLRRFACVFPIARPRAYLWQGVYNWLAGRQRLARRDWHKGLSAAERLRLPYELGRLHAEMGHYLPANDAARAYHLDCAERILGRLGVLR